MDARQALEIWTHARAAWEHLNTLWPLEQREAYGAAMEQLFSAELDAAELLHRHGIDVQRRGEEDPRTGLGLLR
ncbi:MAG: hypothetical protein WDA27_08400 [Actinomycetota bacterium]